MTRIPDPQLQRIRVVPPLEEHERDVLLALAAQHTEGRPARIWSGQPRSRSPWLPCASGCCLTPAPGRVGEHRALWLRFLIREVVAPRADDAVARAARVGLGVSHRLDGTVLVEGSGECSHLVSVCRNRVSETRPTVAGGGPRPGRGSELQPGRGSELHSGLCQERHPAPRPGLRQERHPASRPGAGEHHRRVPRPCGEVVDQDRGDDGAPQDPA